MTCRDCIHYDVCLLHEDNFIADAMKNGFCGKFKNKADFNAEIKRLQAENDDLFYKLQGVMWFVDKWLDGDELEQDELNRAITMREKTLQITEEQQKEIEKLTLKLEGIYGGVDLYKLEYDRAKEEVERLQSMNQAKLDTIHDLMTEIEKLQKEAEKWKNAMMAECMLSNCNREDEIKSQAIKEFEEKLKLTFDKAINGIPRNSKGFPLKSAIIHDIHLIIDEVKKEMVGDDNGLD